MTGVGSGAEPLPAAGSHRPTAIAGRPPTRPRSRVSGRAWRLLPAILPAVGSELPSARPTDRP